MNYKSNNYTRKEFICLFFDKDPTLRFQDKNHNFGIWSDTTGLNFLKWHIENFTWTNRKCRLTEKTRLSRTSLYIIVYVYYAILSIAGPMQHHFIQLYNQRSQSDQHGQEQVKNAWWLSPWRDVYISYTTALIYK